MSSPRSCHQAAREYLALGLHPIPCAPRSKRPLIEWRRYQDVPPLPEELDVWWGDAPDANVALVLGRGTFAVDLDGGPDAERLLHARGITLPSAAPMSRTATGYHVFLSATGPIPDRVGLLKAPNGQPKPPAVDVRGVGIVVAPPSIHPTGAVYEWVLPLSLPFPPAPPDLLALIRAGSAAVGEAPGPVGGAGWVGEALRGVPEGTRDATCTRLAGYFLGRGLDAQIVETLLTEGFAQRCAPQFSPVDVRKCVQSVARREGLHGTDFSITPTPLAQVLDQLAATLGHPPSAIRTPFPSLNHYLTGGFGPGELIYLGSRPGVGKTALGLEIARSAARNGQSVLFISREMVNLALARRILAQDARISASALKLGRLTDADDVLLHEHLPRLKTLPIWLTDEAISIREITDLMTDPVDAFSLVIVDYLQLVRAPLDVKERRLQVEAVSQALKTLAVRCQIPVLCLSSLARPPAESKDKPPTLASLRESGELEHDADIVLLLHRPKGRLETACEVAKNRDGRTGTVMLTFRPEYVSFDEVSDRG